MAGLGFFASIIVGGLAGWIASRIMKARTGLIVNIGLGVIGAIFANFLLGILGFTAAGAWVTQMIVGVLGACLLIGGVRALRG